MAKRALSRKPPFFVLATIAAAAFAACLGDAEDRPDAAAGSGGSGASSGRGGAGGGAGAAGGPAGGAGAAGAGGQVPACRDDDGDGVPSSRCGGTDCCDAGDEGTLGCTALNAPLIYPGVGEGWAIESTGATGDVGDAVVTPDGKAHFVQVFDKGIRYASGAGGPFAFETVDDRRDRGPALALDAAGGLHVAYGDTGFTTAYSNLYYARRGAGATAWSSEQITDDTNSGHYVALAVGPDGSAHILHSDLIGTLTGGGSTWRPRDLFYTTNAGGGAGGAGGAPGWASRTLATAATTTPARTAIAVAPSGQVHVLYINSISGELMHVLIEGEAVTPRVVEAGVGVGDIGLALGEGGRVYASWPGASASGGGLAVRFGVFDAGTWQAEDAYDVGEAPSFAPASDLALDAAGDPHLCVAGVDTVLRYVARKGGVWSSEIVQSPAQQFRCRIGVDAQGGPHIVFSNVGGSPGNPPGQTGQFAIRHAVRSPSPGVDRDCDGAD
ncbi:MAG TPA: hypothetical protein VFS43_34810 [Polyangiaceae bacterium]|nr:hypothetical protein [Polyangiaceae bacterium]